METLKRTLSMAELDEPELDEPAPAPPAKRAKTFEGEVRSAVRDLLRQAREKFPDEDLLTCGDLILAEFEGARKLSARVYWGDIVARAGWEEAGRFWDKWTPKTLNFPTLHNCMTLAEDAWRVVERHAFASDSQIALKAAIKNVHASLVCAWRALFLRAESVSALPKTLHGLVKEALAVYEEDIFSLEPSVETIGLPAALRKLHDGVSSEREHLRTKLRIYCTWATTEVTKIIEAAEAVAGVEWAYQRKICDVSVPLTFAWYVCGDKPPQKVLDNSLKYAGDRISGVLDWLPRPSLPGSLA